MRSIRIFCLCRLLSSVVFCFILQVSDFKFSIKNETISTLKSKKDDYVACCKPSVYSNTPKTFPSLDHWLFSTWSSCFYFRVTNKNGLLTCKIDFLIDCIFIFYLIMEIFHENGLIWCPLYPEELDLFLSGQHPDQRFHLTKRTDEKKILTSK